MKIQVALTMFVLMILLVWDYRGDVSAATHQDKELKIRMAVFYFDNECLTDRKKMEPLRKGLADTLISDLSRLNSFQLVERNKIESLIMELKLGQSGLMDSGTAQRVGRMLGAQMLLLGSFTAIGEMIRIDMRIVDARTGLVVKADEVSGSTSDLFALEERMVIKITEDLAVKLTGDEKARLHRGRAIPFPALMQYSQGLEYLDSGKYAEAAGAFEGSLKSAPHYQDAREKLTEVRRKMGGKIAASPTDRGETPHITIAVFPLEDLDPSADSKGLSETLSASMTDALVKTGKVRTVDRIQLKKLLQEMASSRARPVNQNAALRAGRFLGAQCLFLGSFVTARDQIRINARIVNTETGEVLATGKISGKVSDLTALEENLVKQMITGFKSP